MGITVNACCFSLAQTLCVTTARVQPLQKCFWAKLKPDSCVPQFLNMGGRIAMAVRNAVLDELMASGKLQHYVPRSMLQIPMQLWRKTGALVGRESEVQQIVDSLDTHRVAVIWGGPGEGKSSIAMEAACRLWDSRKCMGGCFEVDCMGAHGTSSMAFTCC